MKKKLLIPFLFLLYHSVFAQNTAYVNPFIGSTNFGATTPGAYVPRGMVQVSPFNVIGEGNEINKDERWNSTVYWGDNSFLTGFTHVHLIGGGCPDLGIINAMPTAGKMTPYHQEYGTTYSNENAKPGAYNVHLNKHNIDVETTASKRVGFSRYTFSKGQGNILINLGLGLTNEAGSTVKIVSDQEVEGAVSAGTLCYNNPENVYPVYFVAKVSKPAKNKGIWKESKSLSGPEGNWMAHYDKKLRIFEEYKRMAIGDSLGVYFSYDVEEGEQIELRVGVSFVSIENARLNLEQESNNLTFDQAVENANKGWNDILDIVEVEGGSEEEKAVFYSSLYRTMTHPNIQNDSNGEYVAKGTDEILTVEKGRDEYTIFSLWDTYRTLHPLMSLLYPKQQSDMVNSMMDSYTSGGWLPKWEIHSQETFTMVGDPAVIVLSDTYFKGIQDFDTDKALEAMEKHFYTENNPIRKGNKYYLNTGWVPLDAERKELFADQKNGDNQKVWACLSTSLEYNIADASISKFASKFGKEKLAKDTYQNSLGYKNYYDPATGVLRPKYANDAWVTPFSPRSGEGFEHVPGFAEGSAWHYTFMVPHDIKGMIKLNGGKKAFIEKLEMIFEEGLYEPDNEPDIGYPYLFTHVKGQEWKTQKYINEILTKGFTNTKDGIPGNDDSGTMAAWAVFSMMGMYPEVPSEPIYTLTTPTFEKITIQLDDQYYSGKELLITAPRNNGDEVYIKNIYWNDKKLNSYFITHEELAKGGHLHFELVSEVELKK